MIVRGRREGRSERRAHSKGCTQRPASFQPFHLQIILHIHHGRLWTSSYYPGLESSFSDPYNAISSSSFSTSLLRCLSVAHFPRFSTSFKPRTISSSTRLGQSTGTSTGRGMFIVSSSSNGHRSSQGGKERDRSLPRSRLRRSVDPLTFTSLICRSQLKLTLSSSVQTLFSRPKPSSPPPTLPLPLLPAPPSLPRTTKGKVTPRPLPNENDPNPIQLQLPTSPANFSPFKSLAFWTTPLRFPPSPPTFSHSLEEPWRQLSRSRTKPRT